QPGPKRLSKRVFRNVLIGGVLVVLFGGVGVIGAFLEPRRQALGELRREAALVVSPHLSLLYGPDAHLTPATPTFRERLLRSVFGRGRAAGSLLCLGKVRSISLVDPKVADDAHVLLIE